MINLSQRLKRLPAADYEQLKPTILAKTGVSAMTYNRVLNGRSHNHLVLSALCTLFGCSLADLQNPQFEFTTPNFDAA